VVITELKNFGVLAANPEQRSRHLQLDLTTAPLTQKLRPIQQSESLRRHRLANREIHRAAIVWIDQTVVGQLGPLIEVGHTGRGAGPVIGVANVGRAVPSVGWLGIVFPIALVLLGRGGIGFVPAVIALTALGIPPIVTNAYAGMRGVDAELVEAGRGMGMHESELVRRVEVPVALPVILAGIRISSVQIVATATLLPEASWQDDVGWMLGGGVADGAPLGLTVADGFEQPSDVYFRYAPIRYRPSRSLSQIALAAVVIMPERQ